LTVDWGRLDCWLPAGEKLMVCISYDDSSPPRDS
jgi:hypothetical protein